MAVSEGVAPHSAWISLGGSTFLLTEAHVQQAKTRKSSTFRGHLPMSLEGAEQTFATLGDNTASIVAQTRGVTGSLITGEIDEPDFDFVSRVIRFSGRCTSAKLHAVKSSEKWINKPGSEIVQDLAGRVGLGVEAEGSQLEAGKQVQIDWAKITDGISYAAAIHKLAEFDGARWWVKDGTLHYSVEGSSGTYTLNYRPPTAQQPMQADFIRLNIRRNIQAGKPIKVTVKSWHPKQKKTFTGTSTVGGNGSTQEYDYHIPNLLQDHVQQHAKSRANEHARHELTLHAELVGDPSIDVAMSLQLNGTGTFDQSYEIDGIGHKVGMKGHTMTITARSAKSGRSAS